jgi:hypothetical protein
MQQTNYFETRENPFILDIDEKDEYDYNDYLVIQAKLEEKNNSIDSFLESLYPEKGMTTTLDEMKRRTKRGVCQKIIDLSNNSVPTQQLYKVGDGGNGKHCIVSYNSLFIDRYTVSNTILQSLEEVGFNGHFLQLIGGFPNPSGREMKYAGVPYSFKIFMILEAKKLGFEKVIWIDSVCYAVNNPENLFEMLSECDAVFRSFPANCFSNNTCENILFPKTIELLTELTGRDVRNDRNINSIIFGLNLNSPMITKFISEYYEMVELGLPFLSSFPEEIVFTTILNKPEYQYIFNYNHERLYINKVYISFEDAKQYQYHFVQR